MTTLLTTSEHRVRDWLLDTLHGQWRALGVPFSIERPASADEVIDPEALLWCSLEFFPTEPRLCEQVLNWWSANDQYLLLPRIRKFAQSGNDPRASIWRALDPQWRASPQSPTVPCYGQESVDELLEFCHRVARASGRRQKHGQPGTAERTIATVLLRARDLLGTDARHFVLIYLLANRGGARLRSIAAWSGQSYRNISKAVQRWEAGNVVALEHGYARLKNADLWATLLEINRPHVLLLDWRRFYSACVTLLRMLRKANARSIPQDGPVAATLLHEAADQARASAEGDLSTSSGTVHDFTRLLLEPG